VFLVYRWQQHMQRRAQFAETRRISAALSPSQHPQQQPQKKLDLSDIRAAISVTPGLEKPSFWRKIPGVTDMKNFF